MRDDMVVVSYTQQLNALMWLWDVERLGGRWHLMLSLSKLWTENGKWCRCAHNNSNNKTVMWKWSIWLLHHWAEGALSKMNAEVQATKLTLTCQINSISKTRGRDEERRGGRSRCQMQLNGNTERNSDLLSRSDSVGCLKSTSVTVTAKMEFAHLCIKQTHMQTCIH